jgi:glycosyltransferase involved in cell wall biosynthesis
MGNGADKIVLELMNSIKDNGISSNIDVKGYVEAKQAYSIMKKSKIFLFTSYAEGWGIAPAEAMACGIPVVAYDLPIFRRLFPKGVFLCKTKNIDEMAEKACKLIENETYRKQQGNEGRSYVLEHYTWDAVAENELNILIQVG